MNFENIEWLVVIVSTIVVVGMTFLWYSKFAFLNAWKAANPARDKESYSKSGLLGYMVLHILSVFFFSILVNIFALADNITGVVVFTLGLLLFGLAAGNMNGDRQKKLYIECGHALAMIIIMVLVNGVL